MDRNTAKIIADNYVSMYRIRTNDLHESIIENIIERIIKSKTIIFIKRFAN